MRRIETDYLVVGAGATGMAFADCLIDQTEASVVLVDRRAAPGGHWLDAYPFVRLHQPSAIYGVGSRVLGHDRIDEEGPNAGFYERATSFEIQDYFLQVLREQLLPTGRAEFLGNSEYRGVDADGHHVFSRVSGEETVVKVRRRLVDATYIESEIPSRHTLPFAVEPDVRVLPPNALVDLERDGAAFTVIGAGKTAMDTCAWLLEVGVDPDRIRWIKTRESWLFDRAAIQPLDLVASFIRMQAHWIEAAAVATTGGAFAHDLEERGVFVRIDPTAEPGIFRGATISRREIDSLRTISRVVRGQRVRRLSTHEIELEGGALPSGPEEIYVDCTAAGVRATSERPAFEPGRITAQYVTVGIAPWSAATLAAVEATGLDDDAKNAACPPVVFTGDCADLLRLVYRGLAGQLARNKVPDVASWNNLCRLNPARGAFDRVDNPEVVAAFTDIMAGLGPAMRNLSRALAPT